MKSEIQVRMVERGDAEEAAWHQGVRAWWKDGTAIVVGIAVQAVALVLTGVMAKEMGGGRWAQVVAALAGVPFCLGAGALMQYISFDYVCWVWVAYCVVRLLGGGEG